ncbi:MAG: hypothetical protein HY042_04905 [Spirochaetia bacterium]|nr:hypothetical protein [Spirochaetia bacterium]
MSPEQLPAVPDGPLALHWSIVLVLLLLYTAAGVVALLASWKIFAKAGHPGWAALVPVYNVYVLTQIVNRSTGFFFLTLVPGAGQIAGIILIWDLFQAFGRPGWEALVPFYNLFIAARISFGNAQYTLPLPRD